MEAERVRKSWQHLAAITFLAAAISLAYLVTDKLTTLCETLRKDDEILHYARSLVSAYDAEYSQVE